MSISETEFERLVGLMAQADAEVDTSWDAAASWPPEVRANLMKNNTPAVARKWLEEEGLLDDQQQAV